MKFKKVTTALLAAISMSCTFAQSPDDAGVYVQVGSSKIDLSYGDYAYNVGTTTPIYVGYDINKNLAVEYMYASASTANYATTLTFRGFYVKPKLPLNDTMDVFARIGSTNTTLYTDYGYVSEVSPSVGLGFTAYFTNDRKNFFTLDWNQWYSRSGVSLSGAGLSIGHKF
jgi:hypothetical protein